METAKILNLIIILIDRRLFFEFLHEVYHLLKNPLKHGTYKEKILEYCNVKYAPFDKEENGNMGYLYALDLNLAAFFIEQIVKKNQEIFQLDYLKLFFVILKMEVNESIVKIHDRKGRDYDARIC